MSILDRVRSVAADRARSSLQGAVSQVIPGVLGDNLVGAIARGITQGPRGFASVIPNLKSSAADLVLARKRKKEIDE